MTDRYENVRKALAMEPTPESWAQNIDEDAAYAIFRCRSAAEAAFVLACDPDTIRSLLDERDALADALEAVQMLLRNTTRVWTLSDEIERSDAKKKPGVDDLNYDALRNASEAMLDALRQIAEWPDGGNRYGQENIKRFAQAAIDAAMHKENRND